jgi:hypothetical protein
MASSGLFAVDVGGDELHNRARPPKKLWPY